MFKIRRPTASLTCIILSVFCAVSQAAEPTLEKLIGDLQGPDQQVRAVARQLLPYRGVEAVPAVMPLLTGKDLRVAKAAYYILKDISNASCAPGFAKQRKQATDHLMKLVQQDSSRREKILGLRLLEVVVPEGFDVGPIAALLKSGPVLRDKARVALERINTTQARATLRSELKGADSRFQCALLNSLGQMKDAQSLRVIMKLTKSSEPTVRAAAARALAWTGDPAYLESVKQVAASADDNTRFEAMDALIRLAESMAEKKEHREIAKSTFLEILNTGKGVQKDAALVGLGRVGDTSCIPAIKLTIEDADQRTRVVGQKTILAIREADVQPKVGQ